jgi:mevalonate kinase
MALTREKIRQIVLHDISKELNVNVERLEAIFPLELSILLDKAISLYGKMYMIKNDISYLEKKKRRLFIFNKSKIALEKAQLERKLEELQKQYNSVIQEIVDKLGSVMG